MPKYYFHYTNKEGFDGINMGRGAGFFHDEEDEDRHWNPSVSQPQKANFVGHQHAEGFYLTHLSPPQILANAENVKGGAKLGIGKVTGETYVFVFFFTDAQLTPARNETLIKEVRNVGTKSYVSKKKSGTETADIPRECFIWCGQVKKFPNAAEFIKKKIPGTNNKLPALPV